MTFVRTFAFKATAAALFTAFAASAFAMKPVTVAEQGSFAAGGTVVEAKTAYDPYHPQAQGQTLHGDHAFVTYQVPEHRRALGLVMLHGAGQFSKTWDTTPDGRDGYRNLFLEKGYPVYLVDQPRRGDAGRSTVPGEISAEPDEGFWFGQFRMGLWPKFNDGSQFPQDEASMDQFFRQMTPNTAPYDAKVNAEALVKVFEKTGDAVFLTHSQGCGVGWLVGMKSDHVKGIAAYEPGSGFPFPKGEVPAPIANNSFFGDLKADEVTKHPHNDYWRAAAMMADAFVKAVNRHGGDARVVHLPDLGIRGNSHFPFAEKNNVEVAGALEAWLKEKRLDAFAK